ncbi:hypothetical protein [Sphingobacterium sp.]|uniref:hypothetical protein n=1 Tax=Sphingobacterium sp. TaxID=341027 RepID=UPI0028A0A151|nr:hypothetical protein [Sphingobacterium sp.]
MVVIKNKSIIYCIALILLNLSCKKSTSRYDFIVKLSNANQKELAAILKYYKGIKEDEKRVMAEYLLDNLPYHTMVKYFISSNNNIIELKNSRSTDSVDLLLSKMGYQLKTDTVLIIDILKAQHFIDHINSFYNLRKKYNWASKINLSDFNKYILPLRVYNEPLINYTAFYQNRYLPYIEDVLVPNVRSETVLENYLAPFFESHNNPSNTISFTSPLEFEKLKDRSKEHTDFKNLKILQNYALRSLGIPSSIEYAPFIDNSNRGEMIVSTFDSDHGTFNHHYYSEIYKFRVAKFYRNTFETRSSINPFFEIYKLGIAYENIPFSLNIPNSIDITSERTKAKDIVIKIDGEKQTEKVLYLVAGRNDSKIVVSWGQIDPIMMNVCFKNIGTQLTYQLASYKKGKLKFIGQQFFLDSLGNIR